jgi:hypothetical protein
MIDWIDWIEWVWRYINSLVRVLHNLLFDILSPEINYIYNKLTLGTLGIFACTYRIDLLSYALPNLTPSMSLKGRTIL